jgi:hypothetical protein
MRDPNMLSNVTKHLEPEARCQSYASIKLRTGSPAIVIDPISGLRKKPLESARQLETYAEMDLFLRA